MKAKEENLAKMTHKIELREIELKNKELALETHPNFSPAKSVPSPAKDEGVRAQKSLAELQMKETLLGEQAVLLQEKEKEIAEREKNLVSKEFDSFFDGFSEATEPCFMNGGQKIQLELRYRTSIRE